MNNLVNIDAEREPAFTVKSVKQGIIFGKFIYNGQIEHFSVRAKDFDELREIFHGYLEFIKNIKN